MKQIFGVIEFEDLVLHAPAELSADFSSLCATRASRSSLFGCSVPYLVLKSSLLVKNDNLQELCAAPKAIAMSLTSSCTDLNLKFE
jgi:hypothetical protein